MPVLSCGGVCGVGGECVGCLDLGYAGVGWCYVCVSCEYGFFVYGRSRYQYIVRG